VLKDLAGNPLDGDGDGSGGDSFIRLFRADPENLFDDGHFDCDLGAWVPASINPSEIFHSADDVDGSSDSGSAAIESTSAGTEFALGQCRPAQGGVDYDLSARVRLATGAAGIGVRLSCEFFDAEDCAGASLGVPTTSTLLLEDTGGAWVPIADRVSAPTGAASLLCAVDLLTASGAAFEARLDRLQLVAPGIFSDGFESGDTSQWSQTLEGGSGNDAGQQ
jgi:hypothetical protein